MALRYLAKVYFDDDEVTHQEGDDVDELYNWMLVKAQGKFGNLSGEIVEIKTSKVVRRFRKSPPD